MILKRAVTTLALAMALVVPVLTFAPSPSLAQEPARQDKSEDPKADSATTFKAAKDGDVVKENLPAWPFLYGAYFAILVLLMAYVTSLWLRQRRLDAEIDRLNTKLDRVEGALATAEEGEGRGA